MTTAQIIAAIQAGRYLAAKDIVAAEAAPHWPGGFYAILADGSRVHSDHLQARAFSVLAALARRG